MGGQVNIGATILQLFVGIGGELLIVKDGSCLPLVPLLTEWPDR